MFTPDKIVTCLQNGTLSRREAQSLCSQLTTKTRESNDPCNDLPPPLDSPEDFDRDAFDGDRESDVSTDVSGAAETELGDSSSDSEEPVYQRVAPTNEPMPADQANFIYAGKFLSGASSRCAVKQEIAIASLSSGCTVNANATKVFNLVDTLAAKFEVSTSYFCGKCTYPLLTATSLCICCGTSAGQSLEFKPFGVATASLVEQLQQVIEKNIDYFENPPAIDPSDRSELYTWHTRQADGTVPLHLILNTDGVTPKQNFQGELNPVYAAIGNLPAHRRGLIANMCCPSIITGRGKPDNEIWKVVIDHLKPELDFLTSTGITVKGLTFKLAHIDVTIDIVAANDIFSSVGHCSTGCGCLKCYVYPERPDNTSLWPTDCEVTLRSAESYVLDAINHENGLKGLTHWYRVQNPCEWRVDGLHTIDKGTIMIFKNIYLHTKTQIAKWNKVFLDGRYPDCTVFRPRTLKQSKRFTANDNRTVYYVLFPIIFYSVFEKSPIKSSMAFLTWLVLRHLGSRYLNVETVDILIHSLRYLGQNINELLFVHCEEDLRTRGTPYDYTTAPFEAMNRVIKVKYHPYDTRSLTGSIMTNLLAWKEWTRKANVFLEDSTLNANFHQAIRQLLPKTRIKKIRYGPVKEGGMFDNSVVRFRLEETLLYGRIIEMQEPTHALIEPYETRPILDTFLDDQTLPLDLRARLLSFRNVVSLMDLVTGLCDPIVVNQSSIIECCCSVSFEGQTFVSDLSFRGPSK